MISTSTIAAPAVPYSYAPAPAVSSYVAPPVGAVTVAASPSPATTVVRQTPSWVPPPAMAMPAAFAPMQFAQMQPPQPPRPLTTGIPTPEQISTQKVQFAATLDKQLQDAVETVKKETEIEKQMVKFNTDKQIALYHMQVDEKLAEMLAASEENATISDLELKKAMVERTIQLQTQAHSLTFDYNMRATQQELATRKAEFERQFLTNEYKMAQEYAATLARAGPAAMPMAVPVMHASAPAPVAPTAMPAATTLAAHASYAALPTYAAAPMTTGHYGAPATMVSAAPMTAVAAAPVVSSVAHAAPTVVTAARQPFTPAQTSRVV